MRTGVDSPMETRLRMLIVLAGLPEPLVNQLVGEESELDFRKYDLCWPSIKLIAKDIYNTPGNTLNRIHRQLVARRLPGVPTHLSSQWQLDFPGRT